MLEGNHGLEKRRKKKEKLKPPRGPATEVTSIKYSLSIGEGALRFRDEYSSKIHKETLHLVFFVCFISTGTNTLTTGSKYVTCKTLMDFISIHGFFP